jgi:hypothetical protein
MSHHHIIGEVMTRKEQSRTLSVLRNSTHDDGSKLLRHRTHPILSLVAPPLEGYGDVADLLHLCAYVSSYVHVFHTIYGIQNRKEVRLHSIILKLPLFLANTRVGKQRPTTAVLGKYQGWNATSFFMTKSGFGR